MGCEYWLVVNDPNGLVCAHAIINGNSVTNQTSQLGVNHQVT